MHAFVRKGLLLSAATGTLVMGYAGSAAAQDSATTHGAAADSPGAVSGNVAQLPADVPIQVCGDAGAAGAGLVGARDNDCWTDNATAEADGVAADSPGAISGNVGSIAANVPVQACGLAAGALAADVTAHDNDCVDQGTHALAKGAAADSPGLVSGNVLQLAADAPVQACGDSVGVLAFGVGAKDNHCVNGAPTMAPPPVMPPPPVPCPPPVTNPCPPPPPGQCPPPGAEGWTPSHEDAATATPLASEIPALLMPAPPVD
ncbi:putative secreted protein [Catenulispora acidiphila DSM 44928]|uniref:Putative secreted protein n=1 Tax=Catenulispora acidiphila (strain DSM 44928 / JCM 14897 / NBRC 102108 / NRRL B-24433 / ID139908) TaxID=479433 RepID=C7PWT6_CATAD|nr:chaplin [Catenulispora acidiphila]ACU77193.1 putative secreted protein [Catenulispora acidiphila DSM 44928]